MTIRWFPAAWLLIETAGQVIYVDPAWVQNNFRSYPKKIIFSHYPEPMDGLPEPDLPKADIILVTHHHQDHIKTATLHRLIKNGTHIIAPEKCKKLIDLPYDVIKPGESRTINGIEITAFNAYNTTSGNSTRKVHHVGDGVSYLIRNDSKVLYHAGDTDYIPDMKKLGKVDVAFLPIGGTFTMDISDAVEAAKAIGAKMTVPMHYLNASPIDFMSKANLEKLSGVQIMTIGQTIKL